MIAVTIGYWVIEKPEDVTFCPSYYAADSKTLELKPGKYPLQLTFEGGYTCPMPYWLLVGIDAVTKGGAYYSGFGGVNFAKDEIPAGKPDTYTIQTYAYHLEDLVKTGKVELLLGFEKFAADHGKQIEAAEALGWEGVKALKATAA